MNTSRLLLVCATLPWLATTAHATVATQSVWHMGESGTLASSNRPIDSSDGDGALNSFTGGGGATPGTGTTDAPGSTAYLTLSGSGSGFYSPSPAQTYPADNFGAEIWIRVPAAALSQSGKKVFVLGSNTANFAVAINDGGSGWGASLYNNSYIGSSVPATADKWTHLAIVRNGGVNQFYVDGTLKGTSTGGVTSTSDGAIHLGISPGGSGAIQADIDEFRIFTFNPGEFSVSDLNFPVPNKFVDVGTSYSTPSANLSTTTTSDFRLGGGTADVATVSNTDGLSVVGASGTHHVIHITQGGPIAVGNYPLIHYTGTIGGLGFAGLELDQPVGRLAATLVNNTSTSTIELAVTGTVSGQITWTGATNGNWDVNTSANWFFNESGDPTTFFAGDDVTFDDQGQITNVTLSGTIAPASVLFNNNSDYTFTGTGISGVATVTKYGSAKVILKNPNTWTGATSIVQGTLQIGDGGSLGTTAINNGATLSINRTTDLTITAPISGSGTLEKLGSGTLTLSGTNTFTGPLVLLGGIIKSGNTASLGSTSVSTTVTSGTTLDINGVGFNTQPLILNGNGTTGQGALINTGAANQAGDAAYNLTLGSDASIGGTSRWDMRGGGFTLTGDFKLTKVGTNEIHLVSGTTTVKDIDVNAGALYMEYGGGITNDSPGTITLNTGGTLALADYGAPVSILKPILINGGTLTNGATGTNGNATIAANVTLGTASSLISPANASTLAITGMLTGSGGLNKTGTGTLALGATSYTGDTTVTAGTLTLGQATLADASTVTIASGAKLNLTFTGIDYVAALNFDTTAQTTGLSYGATGSGADVIDDTHFTGTGRLFLGSAPTGGYAAWAGSHGIAGAAANVDSDHDGIANGIEFVIGGDPSGANDSAKLPTLATDASNAIFTFRRTTDANTSVSPVAQYSTDLITWTTATNGQPGATPVIITTVPASGFTGDIVTVTIPRAISSSGTVFVRLKVTAP